MAVQQQTYAQAIHLPPVTRTTLENGIRVVLMEMHKAPTVTVEAIFPGGSAGDPAGKSGVAALTAELLRRGTEKRDAKTLAEEIDFLGASLGAGASDDRTAVSLGVLSKDLDGGLELFTDIIRHPTFAAEELERQRQLLLAGLQALGEDPGAVANRVQSEVIFAGHPYGLAPSMTSAKAIAREDIQAYHKRFYLPNRMILVAVGDFKTADMLARLKARFGDWPRGDDPALQVPKVTPAPRKIVLVDKPDATQTQVRWGRTAIPRVHPDYFPAQIAEAILGGGFTSRLVEEIRVNRGLTYGISSRFAEQLHGGEFEVSSFTKIETTRKMLDAVRDVLRRTAASGFTPAEVAKVKQYLSGLFAIHMQRPESLAGELADIAFFGLPQNYLQTYLASLRAVTPAQANRIAHTYFNPDQLSLIMVAPAKSIAPQIKGIGAIETRPVESVGK